VLHIYIYDISHLRVKARIISLQSAQVELSDTHRWNRIIVRGLCNNKQTGYLALDQRRRLTRASKGSLNSRSSLRRKYTGPVKGTGLLYCSLALSSGSYLLNARFETCPQPHLCTDITKQKVTEHSSAVVESTPFKFKFKLLMITDYEVSITYLVMRAYYEVSITYLVMRAYYEVSITYLVMRTYYEVPITYLVMKTDYEVHIT
jgi:hypothetical protein